MGQGPSKEKQNKNHFRRKHIGSFQHAIQNFVSRISANAHEMQQRTQSGESEEPTGLRVVLRKRPINDKELERGDFDVISRGVGGELWLHNCDVRLDNKSMFIDHNCYSFDAVFDEHDSSDIVYKEAVQGVVDLAMKKNGIGTVSRIL